MCGAVPPLFYMPSWRGQGQFLSFLLGMNELYVYVDGILELKWIVEMLEV
jgi:hypothetical protein